MLRGGQRAGRAAQKRDAGGTLVNTSAPDYPGASYPYIAANTVDREGELAPAAVRDGRACGRPGRLHRRHYAVHAEVPARPPRRALPIHRHLGRGEPLGARAAPARHPGDRRTRARRRPGAGRVRRPGLRRRDRRGGARDELRGGRGDRRAQPLAARHPRPERGRLGRQADRRGALVRGRVRPRGPHDRHGEPARSSAKTGRIPATPHDVAGDGAMAALVERYRERIAPLATNGARQHRTRRSRARAGSWAGWRPTRSASSPAPTPRSSTRRAARGHRPRADHLRRGGRGARVRPSRHAARR